ncbi:MAG: hypothetical protein ABIG90_00925 [bacterium]
MTKKGFVKGAFEMYTERHLVVPKKQKPDSEQMSLFFRMVNDEKVNYDNFGLFLNNPNLLFYSEIFPVIVDYKLSLEEMLQNSGLDEWEAEINSDNFPIRYGEEVGIRLHTVNLNEYAQGGYMWRFCRMEKNIACAKIEHLLAFLSSFPICAEEKGFIVAPGSWLRKRHRHRQSIFFKIKDGKRILCLSSSAGGYWTNKAYHLVFDK